MATTESKPPESSEIAFMPLNGSLPRVSERLPEAPARQSSQYVTLELSLSQRRTRVIRTPSKDSSAATAR